MSLQRYGELNATALCFVDLPFYDCLTTNYQYKHHGQSIRLPIINLSSNIIS
jgi:hypothetical protein